MANSPWSNLTRQWVAKSLTTLWGALVITDSTERLYTSLLYYCSPQVSQEIHNPYCSKLHPSFPVFCNFLIKSTQEAIPSDALPGIDILDKMQKYFITKLPDWWVTLKQYLSNCYWTAPSKLLSTQLFQMHIVMLVQMSLLLKILLHPTHLFLEDNMEEPIWNTVWHIYLSQAPTLFCCKLIRTIFSCNRAHDSS